MASSRLSRDIVIIREDGLSKLHCPALDPPTMHGAPTGILADDHRRMSNTQLEYEYTVRGSLHWLGVMADWRWEGTF